jgi:hypothetical protein
VLLLLDTKSAIKMAIMSPVWEYFVCGSLLLFDLAGTLGFRVPSQSGSTGDAF